MNSDARLSNRVNALAFSAGAALALTACSSTSDALRARFAREHGCSASEVSVVERGGTVYRASGCGKSSDYVCGSFAYSAEDADRACEERGVPRKARAREEEPVRLPGGTDPEPAPGGPR